MGSIESTRGTTSKIKTSVFSGVLIFKTTKKDAPEIVFELETPLKRS